MISLLWELARKGTGLLVMGLVVAFAPMKHPAGAAEKPYKLIVAAFAAPGTPWDVDWQTFRAHIEANAGERIDLKLLIRGEAGGEPVMMTNIRRNRTQFGGFTTGGAAAVIPELAVLLSPYLFRNEAELDFIMDEFMLDTMQPLFGKKGLVLIRWSETGWLNMFGKKPIILPRDAQNYRLRSQASVASQVMAESLGGDLLQMPFHDLIPALQTGLVQGGVTNVILYSLTGIGKEAPHYTMTRHAYETGIVVANKAWFDSLPADLRKVVFEAFPPSTDLRRGLRALSRSLEKDFAANGVNIYELTPEQKAAWVKTTRDNHKHIIARVGGQAQMVYDRIIEGRRRFRAMNEADAGDGRGER